MALRDGVVGKEAAVAEAEWATAVDELIVASRASRAPHRLVLLLFLIGRADRNESATVTFSDVEARISPVLQLVGRAAKPEALLPFWHLQSSPFWIVEDADAFPRRKGKDRPTRRALLDRDARGSVRSMWWKDLLQSRGLRTALTRKLLDAISGLPATQQDVANLLGVPLTSS
jgi:putative restriction endonuclease